MSKFVPREITLEMTTQGYNNKGRGKLIGYIADQSKHEQKCPYRKMDGKRACTCRTGLWQETVSQREAKKEAMTSTVAENVLAALMTRLDLIIAECRNETSGAEEDKHRDAVLAHIIAIAEGRGMS